MCDHCNWLELAAAMTANLDVRDRTWHSTLLLTMARDQIVRDEHVTENMRDAVETMAEKEGWAVA